MMFNATFNNISAILWRSVLMVEETGIPGENHGPAAIHWQTLSHNVVSSTPRHERDSNYRSMKYRVNGKIYCYTLWNGDTTNMTWLTVTEGLCDGGLRMYSVCRNHNPVMVSSFMNYLRIFEYMY